MSIILLRLTIQFSKNFALSFRLVDCDPWLRLISGVRTSYTEDIFIGQQINLTLIKFFGFSRKYGLADRLQCGWHQSHYILI